MRIETGIHKGHQADGHWSLDNPSSPRQVHYWVPFKHPFGIAPKVTLGLYTFDFDKLENQRIEARVTAITNKGFQITYKTWNRTIVWFAGVYWVAFEDAESDDNDEKENKETFNHKSAKAKEYNSCNNNDPCSPD